MEDRFQAFKTNYLKIEGHNNSVDEMGRSPPFKMAVNQFSDMTEEEFVQERLSSTLPLPSKQARAQRRLLKSERLGKMVPIGPDGEPDFSAV